MTTTPADPVSRARAEFKHLPQAVVDLCQRNGWRTGGIAQEMFDLFSEADHDDAREVLLAAALAAVRDYYKKAGQLEAQQAEDTPTDQPDPRVDDSRTGLRARLQASAEEIATLKADAEQFVGGWDAANTMMREQAEEIARLTDIYERSAQDRRRLLGEITTLTDALRRLYEARGTSEDEEAAMDHAAGVLADERPKAEDVPEEIIEIDEDGTVHPKITRKDSIP